MKKNLVLCLGAMLMLAFGMSSCSKDDEKDVETSDYDPTYEVSYYEKDPGLNVKQSHRVNGTVEEYIPQSEPPYSLLVSWNDEKGKQAIDYVLEKNPHLMTKEAEILTSNEYRISTKKYFKSPYFYVSSSYKSSEHDDWGVNPYRILILPQILLKMKDGCSIDVIQRDYADVLTLKGGKQNLFYNFDCNLKTSCEIIQLAFKISQRNDVEYAETNMYGGYTLF